ncbi:hypothetical protein DMENIID0001_068400 [Sergentomyia squamirostris]
MDSAKVKTFTYVDYFCFAIVLLFSAAIGFYHGVKSRKRPSTKEEYLLGGRNMGLIPVICSLTATSASGMTILGLSAEAYTYGIHTWLLTVTLLIGSIIFIHMFLPIFIELNLTSSFEYFELRFSKGVRIFASVIYTISNLVILPVTIYVPALAFQEVTGIDLTTTVTILSLLCALYTAIGGFKAVVWTDVLQLVLMITASCIVAIVGIYSVGGVGNVWNAADRTGRLNWINYHDINSRTTIFGYMTSSILNIYLFGLNQAFLQRYLSLPSLKKTKIASIFVAVIFGAFICLAQFTGIIMYTTYETCDPFTSGAIKKMDQILPYFIQDKAYYLTGFNGIFIAGLFSASLSTTSSYLNALSGTIYEDFLNPWLKNIHESTVRNIIKSIVIILGLIQILMVFLIQRMGMIFQINYETMSISASSLLGLFASGILFRRVNAKGAQIGAVVGVLIIGVFIIGGLDNKPEPTLPLRTDGCDSEYSELNLRSFQNSSISESENKNSSEDVFWLFRISFVYYGLIGLCVNLLVSYLASLLTGGNVIKDERLLAPFLRKHIKSVKTNQELNMQKENLIR